LQLVDLRHSYTLGRRQSQILGRRIRRQGSERGCYDKEGYGCATREHFDDV
jgi:hypothetical protein